MSAACSKRGLRLILFCDGHLPVPIFEIQSGEPFGPMEGVQRVIYLRQRVSILDGSRVKLAEVHTKAQATVFLPHHHQWGSPWAVRGPDDIVGQHLLHLSHLLSANCGVLPVIGLAEQRPMGLDLMLQQRRIPEVIFPLAEYIAKLTK